MEKNKTLKLIVTGGAGFIGSHLTDKLIEAGHDVIIIDNLSTGKKSQINKKAKFVKADIRELTKIKPHFKGVDYVFHLAALARIQPSIINPVPPFEVNVQGTLNVLIASRDSKVKKVIYSASSSSYGDQKSLPLKESMMPGFKSPYSLTKYVGEEICNLFSKLYGIKTVSLRYFNVYGPRQLTTGAYATVIGIFLKQLSQKRPITIVGDGTIERDFTHVSDVVKANILAMKSGKSKNGEVINIGAGKKYSINKLASIILDFSKTVSSKETELQARLTGYVPPSYIHNKQTASATRLDPVLVTAIKEKKVVFIAPRPGETRQTLADHSKAKKLLGWEPTITLERGLKDLINK
ncbi:MAG: NAD-dependent dehydratase [Candidatus Yanofskybacteria bacterium CG10_big_fil_rev_8_21_14_0_10_36_16]|uniref:NAD-dependent dehydratase n=1 Tax=Candidatus Yanofskybacteria bacterium CG10_big_fil_rev_8_21_14_0_10_36_16 TaxID=1975096 RepID=A0A2J0QBG0_9BACT|nr:MAG: NAD-dependent dehydratase [Candidatus Yanofskybacteria bacterium CG10_big_fil_rev_8_21_14_0_10_36_16]